MKIILIRHGKPTSAINPKIKACEYAKWVKRYNASDVSPHSRPTSINTTYKPFYTLSSDLKRAIHSTAIYSDKKPEKIDKLYREMEIPRYKLPFRLKAWHWVIVSRVLWMLGCKGSFESYKEAKQRADLAALQLINIAQQQNNIVLFGHGYMNLHIRKSLMRKGWLLKSKSNAYWGVTTLVMESSTGSSMEVRGSRMRLKRMRTPKKINVTSCSKGQKAVCCFLYLKHFSKQFFAS